MLRQQQPRLHKSGLSAEQTVAILEINVGIASAPELPELIIFEINANIFKALRLMALNRGNTGLVREPIHASVQMCDFGQIIRLPTPDTSSFWDNN